MTAHWPAARISRRRLLGLALGSAAVGLVRPSALAAAQAGVLRATLPNGLVVVAEERRSAETVAVRLTARVGGRDTPDRPGLALLTSRVMFQGTSRHPSETDLQRAATLVGGTLERGTTVEYSLISSVVPSFEADVGFDLVSDVAKNASMTQDALERQKRIALQDLTQRRASPTGLAEELFTTSLFAGHPLATPLVGTPESIGAIARDELFAARDRLWGANNLALAIVGNLQADQALAKAAQFFGPLPAGRRNERQLARLAGSSPGTVIGEAGQQQAQFRIGFPAPAQRDPDSYPFMLLNAITSGSSGLIFRELRSERGLVYSAGSAYIPYQDAGVWFAAAGVDPQNLDSAIEVARSAISRLPSFPVTSADIQGLAGQVEGLRALAEETNAARADRLAAQELLGVEPIEELAGRLSAVTPADLQRVARDYLQPERAVTVVVGPPAR